jgi:hypothetical protein
MEKGPFIDALPSFTCQSGDVLSGSFSTAIFVYQRVHVTQTRISKSFSDFSDSLFAKDFFYTKEQIKNIIVTLIP